MRKIIDLHVHTNISDGALSPKEVIDEASKNEVSVLAISDHDTIDAYTEEIFEYAESKKIKLLNAVEISTKYEGVGFHVLGYNFKLDDNEFRNRLYLARNARHIYLREVSEKLRELGYKINTDKLDEIEAVTKAHIALDVVSNSENKEILMKRFGHIPVKGEFIETVMNEGCEAYVEKKTVTPAEAVKSIKEAGGKAFLAHPIAYECEDGLSKEYILNLAKEMKADGIETNYIYIDYSGKRIDEIAYWNKVAKENGFMTSIGSDFHMFIDGGKRIGLIDENIEITDEEIDKILENIYK